MSVQSANKRMTEYRRVRWLCGLVLAKVISLTAKWVHETRKRKQNKGEMEELVWWSGRGAGRWLKWRSGKRGFRASNLASSPHRSIKAREKRKTKDHLACRVCSVKMTKRNNSATSVTFLSILCTQTFNDIRPFISSADSIHFFFNQT